MKRFFCLGMSALLLGSSFLPWLTDPITAAYTAWNLPVYLGYQASFFNYGELCLCLACLLCLLPSLSLIPILGRIAIGAYTFVLAAFLCALPVSIFLLQCLLCDIPLLTQLARHKQQALLIQQLFTYQVTEQLLPLEHATLHLSTIWGRSQLLINQLSPALFLPLLLCFLSLAVGRSLSTTTIRRFYTVFALPGVILLALLFFRPMIGLVYEYKAREALSVGYYEQALSLLDTAHTFLPALDDAAYYHIERGQALYFLDPLHPVPESLAYLATTYRSQKAYLDAFQQGNLALQSLTGVQWLKDELSVTLEEWVASMRPLESQTAQTTAALSWLQMLSRIDAKNVYSLYLAARINHMLHSYTLSIGQCITLLTLSRSQEIRSSAYTYLALDYAGLGNQGIARSLLLQAIFLDPAYRNNVAREALSGLR